MGADTKTASGNSFTLASGADLSEATDPFASLSGPVKINIEALQALAEGRRYGVPFQTAPDSDSRESQVYLNLNPQKMVPYRVAGENTAPNGKHIDTAEEAPTQRELSERSEPVVRVFRMRGDEVQAATVERSPSALQKVA